MYTCIESGSSSATSQLCVCGGGGGRGGVRSKLGRGYGAQGVRSAAANLEGGGVFFCFGATIHSFPTSQYQRIKFDREYETALIHP